MPRACVTTNQSRSSCWKGSVRGTDAFFGGREATTGNTSAARRLFKRWIALSNVWKTGAWRTVIGKDVFFFPVWTELQWNLDLTNFYLTKGNVRTMTTTGSELQCTAQARPVNSVVVVSSTTPNKVLQSTSFGRYKSTVLSDFWSPLFFLILVNPGIVPFSS